MDCEASLRCGWERRASLGPCPALGVGGSGWGGHLEGEAAPLEALVRVVGQGEGGDDQPAGHTAKLPAEPLHILADALVPTAANT